MSCLNLKLGSANERRGRWDIFPWCLPVMLWYYSGFILLTSTVCILEWVKEYIEGKKREREEENMYWWVFGGILCGLKQKNAAMSNHSTAGWVWGSLRTKRLLRFACLLSWSFSTSLILLFSLLQPVNLSTSCIKEKSHRRLAGGEYGLRGEFNNNNP